MIYNLFLMFLFIILLFKVSKLIYVRISNFIVLGVWSSVEFLLPKFFEPTNLRSNNQSNQCQNSGIYVQEIVYMINVNTFSKFTKRHNSIKPILELRILDEYFLKSDIQLWSWGDILSFKWIQYTWSVILTDITWKTLSRMSLVQNGPWFFQKQCYELFTLDLLYTVSTSPSRDNMTAAVVNSTMYYREWRDIPLWVRIPTGTFDSFMWGSYPASLRNVGGLK
jgi:hypothetical protein